MTAVLFIHITILIQYLHCQIKARRLRSPSATTKIQTTFAKTFQTKLLHINKRQVSTGKSMLLSTKGPKEYF